jgi:hypothetical protein
MRRVLSSVSSLLLVFGFAGEAAAKMEPGKGCWAADRPIDPVRKKILIVNNSQQTIYPVIQVPKYDANLSDSTVKASADLWMQAQCNIAQGDANTRKFNTTTLYRAWINHPLGIAKGQKVEVEVPFYTQIKPTCPPPTSAPHCISGDNLGKVPDQFIDWFNSTRIYFFYGNEARTSAFLDGNPQPINFGGVSSQIRPICLSPDFPGCQITFKTYTINPRDNIPFQLQEYTFAAAVGPPPGGSVDCSRTQPCFQIDPAIVNYNVSSLDSVYLPVAMGPMKEANQDPKLTKYLGDADTVEAFHNKLNKFANVSIVNNVPKSTDWPFYIPVYFANLPETKTKAWPPIILPPPPQPGCAFIRPFIGDPNPAMDAPIEAYPSVKIPGTFNLLIESFRKVFIPPTQTTPSFFATISPPLLSSQPSNFQTIKNFDTSKCGSVGPPPFTSPPAVGKHALAMINLWNRCLGQKMASPTCDKIRMVSDFFKKNYDQSKCTRRPLPNVDAVAMMVAVYGWVPIKAPLYPIDANDIQCTGGGLVDTDVGVGPTYATVIEKYCELQYNYLDPTVPRADVFNPYTYFIHGVGPLDPNKPDVVGLGSTAYAFSIDDAQAFRSLPAPGVIIAIGGTNGLEDKEPTPLPTPTTFKDWCKFK